MPLPAPTDRLEALMSRLCADIEATSRAHPMVPRRRPETFVDVERRAVSDVISAFTRPETDIDRFNALAALGIDVWGREELARVAQHHLCMGWSAERSAAVLRGRMAADGEAA